MDVPGGSGERHCRACLSVEELMKRAREFANKVKPKANSYNDTSASSSLHDQNQQVTQSVVMTDKSEEERRKDCPVDKEELGRSSWDFLHTMAAYFPEVPSEDDKFNARSMMTLMGKMYPCPPCAEGLRKDLTSHPPRVDSRDAFSEWMCEMHNRVNDKLGKPAFDCSMWKERWLDGWKDGSCAY